MFNGTHVRRFACGPLELGQLCGASTARAAWQLVVDSLRLLASHRATHTQAMLPQRARTQAIHVALFTSLRHAPR